MKPAPSAFEHASIACWATALRNVSVYATPGAADAGGKPGAKMRALCIVRGERCRIEVLPALCGGKGRSKGGLVACQRVATFGPSDGSKAALIRAYTRVSVSRIHEAFGALSFVPGNLSDRLPRPASPLTAPAKAPASVTV